MLLDGTGHYRVQLGATLANGVPMDLFATGEARWLEVQIAGRPPQPRVLLASVPYALKAADAATLGGLPASAFVLAGINPRTTAAVPPAVVPDLASTVTTTGGTANNLAKFSGASTIVNSILFDNGTDVGIGTTTPTTTLDVNGTALVSGALTANGGATIGGSLALPALGTATASGGFNSQLIKIETSAYNSSTMAVVDPRFEWEAVENGNNTAAPSATLDLLSSTTTAGATKTGFSFNPNGTINFAAGQTFPEEREQAPSLESPLERTHRRWHDGQCHAEPGPHQSAGIGRGQQLHRHPDHHRRRPQSARHHQLDRRRHQHRRRTLPARLLPERGQRLRRRRGQLHHHRLHTTATGFGALAKRTWGANNTAVGFDALSNLTGGDFNTAIGQLAGVANGNLSNTTAVGASATAGQNNTLILGGTTFYSGVGVR